MLNHRENEAAEGKPNLAHEREGEDKPKIGRSGWAIGEKKYVGAVVDLDRLF